MSDATERSTKERQNPKSDVKPSEEGNNHLSPGRFEHHMNQNHQRRNSSEDNSRGENDLGEFSRRALVTQVAADSENRSSTSQLVEDDEPDDDNDRKHRSEPNDLPPLGRCTKNANTKGAAIDIWNCS